MHLRRALAIGTAAISLVAVGCSDDDDSAPTTTAAEAPGTTGEAPATTGGATETTEAAGDGLVDLANDLAGEWTGTWSNTTFGSSGAASATLTVDEAAGTVEVVMDLGGNVFGSPDPDAETFSFPIEAGTHEGTSAVFGDYVVEVAEDGSYTLTSSGFDAIPGGTFSAEGSVSPDGFTGTYEVDFGDDRDPAVGTFELTKS